MHLLRTLQLDGSDNAVFDRTATPGEWAVTGAFIFLDDTEESLTGKSLQAFRNGFLGVDSFGWATLAQIAEIDKEEGEALIELLARRFVERLGAPSLDAAMPVARSEVEYTASVCDRPPGTVVALSRSFNNEGIVENIHIANTNAGGHDALKIWQWDPDS